MSGTTPDSVTYPEQGYGILGPLPANVINIQDVPGADPTGNDDSTNAINIALASLPDDGGELIIAPGIYKFSGNLVAYSNTVISGTGTLKAAPLAEWEASPYYGITNANNTASVITDENITVRNITIDYSDFPSADGTRHCIYIRKARRVVIQNVTILGGSSAIALLGCDDTQEIGNRLVGFSNCGSDHWDGPSNGRLIGCHIETAVSAQMVNWNAVPTVGDADQEAAGFVMIGNTLVSTEVGGTPCQLEPLGTTAQVRDITVTGNRFFNSWLVLRGLVHGATITGNMSSGFDGANEAITSYARNGGTPTGINVSGNVVRDPLTSVGNLGVIRVESDSGTILGNSILGTGYGCVAIYRGTTTAQIFGNYIEGTAVGGELQTGFRIPPGTGSTRYIGWQDNAGTTPRIFLQAVDNNWIMQSTDASGVARIVWSILTRNSSSDFIFTAPVLFNGTWRNAVSTLAAAGTVIGTATALTGNSNNITTCTAGVADGVILVASTGRPQTVINSTAATLNVYPNNSGSAQIDNGGASVPATIAAGKSKTFMQVAANDFRTIAAT